MCGWVARNLFLPPSAGKAGGGETCEGLEGELEGKGDWWERDRGADAVVRERG
jgi:hypothetical protein